jgi:hypothetical protein
MSELHIQDISCKTCKYQATIGCPITIGSSCGDPEKFVCSEHQEFGAFIAIAKDAILAASGKIRFERGGCHQCKTTIWSDEASVVQEDGKSYHLVCAVTKRAEKAEAEASKLTAINKKLEQLIKTRHI